LWGTAVQYVSMPLLTYATAATFGFQGPLLAGVVIVGCVPGAMASNVLTLMAHGNVSYSVSLTTSATLLSPLVVPISLWLFLGRAEIDYDPAEVAWRLLLQVVLPVLAGHVLGRSLTGGRALSRRFAEATANLVIIWLIAVVVAQNRDRLHEIDASLVTALLLVNLGGYLAGYLGALAIGLPEAMRRALSLEVGMQNAGLGVVLANQFFSREAAVPPAVFAFGCMLTGAILARSLARFFPLLGGARGPAVAAAMPVDAGEAS
jgi:BASS family bile acid:Na+ symporter